MGDTEREMDLGKEILHGNTHCHLNSTSMMIMMIIRLQCNDSLGKQCVDIRLKLLPIIIILTTKNVMNFYHYHP